MLAEEWSDQCVITPEMRKYLGQRFLDMPLLYDVLMRFRKEFGLSIDDAALAVAQWIRETQ